MIGGKKEMVDTVLPMFWKLLEKYGLGKAGAGQHTKINQITIASTLQSVLRRTYLLV